MVKSRKFLFLQIFLTLLMAFLILSLPVSARTIYAAAYTVTGYSGTETAVFAPESGDVRRLDMTNRETWDFSGDAMKLRSHIKDGWEKAMAILDPEECDGQTTFELQLADDLSAYEILYIGVGMSAKQPLSAVRAELTLSDASGNIAVARTEIPEPEEWTSGQVEWSLLAFDLSAFDDRDDMESLRLTLTYDEDTPPYVLQITNPYAKNEENSGFDYVERYLTNTFTVSEGTFAMKKGSARPDGRGNIRLCADFILAEQPRLGSDVFLEVTLSHVTSGNLTVMIEYENGNVVSYGRLSMNSSGQRRDAYTIPIETNARLKSFELRFDSVVCDNFFTVESIRLYATERVEVTGNADLGKVTSITHQGDSLVFSGEMERNAVRKYSDYTLGFYAVPGWTSDDLTTAVQIGQMKISTRFDYTANLSAYPDLAGTYRFFVGLTDGEGNVLPLSSPVYPDATKLPETKLSNIGLYDAASVGVFESNASHVIVDVPIHELLVVTDAEEQSGNLPYLSYTLYSTTTRRPTVKGERNRAEKPTSSSGNILGTRVEKQWLNRDLLRRLDDEINFYISAGLEVYLRLTSKESIEIENLTYGEGGAFAYAVCPETPEARYLYTAIVRFLCDRYNGIGGLIVGENVNDGRYTGGGMDGENAAVYARELAEVCRLTYNAAFERIPDILIVLPFGESTQIPDASDPFGYIAPESLTVMLSSYLEHMGEVPWVMMYCTDGTESIVSADLLMEQVDGAGMEVRYSDRESLPWRIKQRTNDLGLDGSADILYFCKPNYEDVRRGFALNGEGSLEEYLAEVFAELCSSTRARAVFLSLEAMGGQLEHEFYASLKNTETSSGGIQTVRRSVSEGYCVPIEDATDKLATATGVYMLWDFTDKFYPLGWIAGGGVSSCSTVYSDLFDGGYARALRSVITPDVNDEGIRGTAAGISLRNLSRTADFTGVDYLEFTFALNSMGLLMGTGQESGSVVFVLGSDDRRVEFEVKSVAYGQALTYFCDLSDYAYRDKVDFVGVMVHAENEVYLDLASVKVYSKTLDSVALQEVFFPKTEEESPVELYTIVVTAGIVCAISLMAAGLLFRHDAEERRERQLLRQAEEERRRKRERIRRLR